MRLATALIVSAVLAGTASTASAQCEKCPKGFTFWHSKETCLANDGSGASADPLYLHEEREREMAVLHGAKLGGRKDGTAGPKGD